eukprot:7372843-Pyramimonas_sp.AAC.1
MLSTHLDTVIPGYCHAPGCCPRTAPPRPSAWASWRSSGSWGRSCSAASLGQSVSRDNTSTLSTWWEDPPYMVKPVVVIPTFSRVSDITCHVVLTGCSVVCTGCARLMLWIIDIEKGCFAMWLA